jgi:hypothetical protein
MYIWRRGPWRLEFLPPWVTALGETLTVGSTGRWGQTPTAVATGGRIPSTVATGGRIPSAVAHGRQGPGAVDHGGRSRHI